MFAAYFDASGQEHEHPYMVVAGFVSNAKDWSEFSDEWKSVLGDYGLKTFHAADCQNFKGEFQPWKGHEGKRLRLWCDLLGIIKKHTFRKFGIGIEISDWKQSFSEKRKKQLKINAYVLCALASAERVQLWARREGIHTSIERAQN
jgi:hypothetical protein